MLLQRKGNYQQMERQLSTNGKATSRRRKMFASHKSDTGLRSKIYKEFLQLCTKRQTIQYKKWSENMNIFQKKACRWSTDTWKDVQCH